MRRTIPQNARPEPLLEPCDAALELPYLAFELREIHLADGRALDRIRRVVDDSRGRQYKRGRVSRVLRPEDLEGIA